jgi:tetratricopeptide (TPR) repeat protein
MALDDSVVSIHELADDHDEYDEQSRSLHRRLSNFHLDPTIEVISDIIRSYRELLGRPSGSDAHITNMAKLAGALFTLGEYFDDDLALSEAMSLERDVLAMRPEGHTEHWFHCLCAAATMNIHFIRTEDMSLLEQVIALNRKAVNTYVHNSSHGNDIAMAYAALAQSLHDYWRHMGDVKSLEEAITLRRQVLALRPTTHPLHTQACDDLALSLESIYTPSPEAVPAAIEEAVVLRRTILALGAPDDEDAGNHCDKLGRSLGMLYSVTKDPSTLRERLDVSARAISVCKNDLMLHTEMLIVRASLLCQHHPNSDHESDILAAVQSSRELRASVIHTLPQRVLYNHVVSTFCDLLSFSTHPDVLEEAIMAARKAYEGFSSRHQHRVHAGSTLAMILSKVHSEVYNDALIIEAIVLERDALAFTRLGHVNRVQLCANLANTLCERFRRTGDRALLDEAIDLTQEAFDIICKLPGDTNRSLTVTLNLTYMILLRHAEDKETTVKDLRYCIELERMAYSKCPPGHPEEGRACGNLAGSLYELHKFEPSVPLHEEIIELFRKAASVTSNEFDYVNKAIWTCNTGILLYDRYLRLQDESLLKEAIHAHQEADELCPSQWRPSNMLCKLYLLRNSSVFDIGLAIEYLHKSVSSNFDNPVEFLTQTAARLDEITSHNVSILSQQGLLLQSYGKFMDFLPLLTNIALESSDMLHALRPVRGIGADALVLAVRMGLPQQGLQILEQARGNLWQQELHLRDPQLEDLPDTQARELKQLFARIQMQRTGHGAPLSSAMRDERHDCGAQIDALLKEIRTTPGFDRFMLEPEYETLTKAASNHPVVVLASSKLGCYAIVLRKASEAPLCIALDVRDEDLKTWVELTSIGQNRGAESPPVEAKTERGMRISLSSRADGVEVKLAALWHRVVKPVLQALKIQV